MIVACPICASTEGWNADWRPRRDFYGADTSQLFLICQGCGYEETTTRAREALSRGGALSKRRR